MPRAQKIQKPLSKNLFLSSLSSASREMLLKRSTAVPLPIRTEMHHPERPATHAYFMTSGVASVVTEMAEGGSAEIGMQGHDGIVGALQVLGPAVSQARCFVQMEGTALRIPIADLRTAFRDSEEVQRRVLELVQTEAMVLGQVAGCHRLHNSEERLARWLLMAQDQTQTDLLEFTQEFLADMLGARRATVTLVAGALQTAKLIEYHRGHVKVLNRKRLEEAACECYQVIKKLRGELYRKA